MQYVYYEKGHLKDVLKEVWYKDALKGSSPSAPLIPGLHYGMCNGKCFGLWARSHTGGWDTRLLNAATNQLPLTESQEAACYSASTFTPLLSLALSAAKGDNLEKGNPKEIIVQRYFSSLRFFNDLVSRLIPADSEISNNFSH